MTPDQLSTILEEGDFATHLSLADWLDEQGQSDLAYAVRWAAAHQVRPSSLAHGCFWCDASGNHATLSQEINCRLRFRGEGRGLLDAYFRLVIALADARADKIADANMPPLPGFPKKST